MACVRMRVADRWVLKLIARWLKASVVETEQGQRGWRRTVGPAQPQRDAASGSDLPVVVESVFALVRQGVLAVNRTGQLGQSQVGAIRR